MYRLTTEDVLKNTFAESRLVVREKHYRSELNHCLCTTSKDALSCGVFLVSVTHTVIDFQNIISFLAHPISTEIDLNLRKHSE